MVGYVQVCFGVAAVSTALAVGGPTLSLAPRRALLLRRILAAGTILVFACTITLLAFGRLFGAIIATSVALLLAMMMLWVARERGEPFVVEGAAEDDDDNDGGGGGTRPPESPEPRDPTPDGLRWDEFDRLRGAWEADVAPPAVERERI